MTEFFNFNRMVYFIAIIEERSITAAAKRLGISKAVVSNQLQLLEKDLGSALVLRNTRHLKPTQIGQQFYEQCNAAVSQAQFAYETVKFTNVEPSGKLFVTAPLDYGTLHVSPIVGQFVKDHPKIEIHLMLSDDQLELIENQVDLAFRVGWLKDSSNRARKLGDFSEWVVGSPGLTSQIDISGPSSLTMVPFVANSALKDVQNWSFTKKNQTVNIRPSSVVLMNAAPAIARVVSAGRCFSILPDFMVRDSVNKGELERLLPDWSLRNGGIYALTSPVRYKSLALQRFIDAAVSHHQSENDVKY